MEVKLCSILKQASDSVGKKVIPRNGTRECEESRLSTDSEVPVFYRGKLKQICSRLSEVEHSETRKQVFSTQETQSQAEGIISVAHFQFLKESSQLKIRTKVVLGEHTPVVAELATFHPALIELWLKDRGKYGNADIPILIYECHQKSSSYLL